MNVFPSRRWGGAAACLALALLSGSLAAAQSPAPGRDYEPVVLRGATFAEWVGIEDLTRIRLYTYTGNGQFDLIPFQIDKRRKINLRWNRHNDSSGFLAGINVCENGYFREKQPPTDPQDPFFQDPFVSDVLHATDEVVFLFKDSGALSAPVTQWVSSGSTRNRRYEIFLRDARTGAGRFVYAFLWDQTPPALSTTDYVEWEVDTNWPTDPCTSDAPAAACGTADTTSAITGVHTHRTHFDGNWITDQYSVKPSPGSYYPDLLTRIEYRMNGENEDSWSSMGNGRRFLGIIDGPVRIVRGIQGAQSGQHTTKYEYFYPSQFQTRVNLRVHPLTTSTLNVRANHEIGVALDSNASDGTETYVWTESHKASNGVAYDKIDGECGEGECVPVGVEAYEDWTEIASEVRGSYVSIEREPRPIISTSRKYIYSDDVNQLKVGEFGRQWFDIGNTQDGLDNAGGCGVGDDPEGVWTGLHFRRMEFVNFPQPLRGNAAAPAPPPITPHEVKQNDLLPVLTSARRQIEGQVPLPPVTPCVPGLTAANTGTGTINLSVDTTGCAGMTGYRLYRAEGAAPLAYLFDLGGGTVLTDRTARRGKSFRYAVTAYNEENVEGAHSTEAGLTVVDTTPPAVPMSLIGTAGDQSATLDWAPIWEDDIRGFNVYMSTSAGGPYIKINGAVVNAAISPQWAVGGLANGQTYHFRITAVDFSGNESAESVSVDVTPSP
jgi:hypothetical protein